MIKIVYLFFLISYFSIAQQKNRVVDFYEVYEDNELLRESSTDSVYTGLIHRKRKNGQLIQEDYVKKGVIHYTNLFYRKGTKLPHSKYIYNKEKPFILSQVINYHLEGDIYQITYYDYDGRRILEEDYENGKMIYSCEFDGRKRHGREFCITDKCDTTFVYYANGKKLKK